MRPISKKMSLVTEILRKVVFGARSPASECPCSTERQIISTIPVFLVSTAPPGQLDQRLSKQRRAGGSLPTLSIICSISSQAARVSKLRSRASSSVVSATSSILRSTSYTPMTLNARAITFPSIRQKWSHRRAISEYERQQPWRAVQTLTR